MSLIGLDVSLRQQFMSPCANARFTSYIFLSLFFVLWEARHVLLLTDGLHIFGNAFTYFHTFVYKSQLVYAWSFLAFAEKTSLKENLKNNIYIARLSYFIFCVPASHVLSYIYVNRINVEGEKKWGSTAKRRTNKTAVLWSIPKEAFADSFQKLYERCQLCVVKDSDYF
jgi:hypothetical protein